jgi:hypothetical protein
LRECDGYFDGDGKVLVVDDSVLEEMWGWKDDIKD